MDLDVVERETIELLPYLFTKKINRYRVYLTFRYALKREQTFFYKKKFRKKLTKP